MSFRAGFVGMIGLPNAGKSTLMNVLVGEKVGIVNRKPQTTRQNVVGIYSDEEAQIMFVDAPGMVEAKSGLNLFLQKELERVIDKTEVLLVVLNLDADHPSKLEKIIEIAVKSGKPWMAVITKADLVQRHRILMIQELFKSHEVPLVTVSAVGDKEQTLREVLPALKNLLPVSPGPLYDPALYTTQSGRELASEIIREKCFEFLHQEIPYGLAVEILKYVEDEGPPLKIYAQIIVSKEGHRSMTVGRAGTTIKRIGMAARQDLEQITGEKIYLDLHVKVKVNWMRDENQMRELGYVFSH